MDRADDAVPIAELLDERRQLLDVAHWMLGSGSGSAAENVVDETYRRWYALSEPARARITSPRFWLAQVTGSICLARLTLPGHDGTRAGGGRTGDSEAERPRTLEEEISATLRGVLDSLSPAERAVFVLNDVFRRPRTAADIVRQPGPECSEPADHSRSGLGVRRTWPMPPRHNDTVAHTVRHACTSQDEALLLSVLAPDVTAFFDGGGKIRVVVEPVHGDTRVARYLLTLLPGHPRTGLHTQSVNGRTGLVVRYDHQVAAVIGLDIAGRHVIRIWAILNPDKLRTWNGVSPTRSSGR
ncbi:RNA polymerase subunit sigma [Streptomyces sp. MMS24-I2-30]|uniref:RNA polymerase subunit sigma n=1 Tax=Streptomyces sp. MMS24-I2-30 TaxID=3351564 RepID=UPI003896A147